MIPMLKYPLLSLLTATLMAAPFVGLQLWFWRPSWIWIAGFTLLGWGPMVLGLTLKLKERMARRQTAIYIGFILVCVSLYTAGLWAWHTPQVRVWSAQALANQRVTAPLVACSNDPSEEVAQACCEALEPMGTHTSQDRWASWLYKHPKTPNACMVRSITGTSYAANVLSSMMVEQWSDTLRTTQPTQKGVEDQLCSYATHLRHLDRVKGIHASAHLLSCALEASHPAAAQCCAQQLKVMSVGGDVTQALPNGAIISKTPLARRLPDLLSRLMPTRDLKQEVIRRRALEPLPFDPLRLQTWALHVSCHSLKTHNDRALEGRLRQGIEAAGCGIDVQSLSTTRIKETCALLLEIDEMPPEGGASWMCSKAKDNALQASVEEAHRGVRRAYHRAFSAHASTQSKLTRAILDTDLPYASGGNRQSPQQELVSKELMRKLGGDKGPTSTPFVNILWNQTHTQAKRRLRKNKHKRVVSKIGNMFGPSKN